MSFSPLQKLFVLVFILPLLSMNLTHGNEEKIGKILVLKGKVTLNGKLLSKQNFITNLGTLKTHDKALVKILLLKNNTLVTLGSNSEILLEKPSAKKGPRGQINHISGLVRWTLKKVTSAQDKKGAKKERLVVASQVASMAVRGTDFMSVSNPLLGETEIVVFEGRVLFQSKRNKRDKKTVRTGQWGGIGGRFGKNIGKLIKLPPHVLQKFKENFEL